MTPAEQLKKTVHKYTNYYFTVTQNKSKDNTIFRNDIVYINILSLLWGFKYFIFYILIFITNLFKIISIFTKTKKKSLLDKNKIPNLLNNGSYWMIFGRKWIL